MLNGFTKWSTFLYVYLNYHTTVKNDGTLETVKVPDKDINCQYLPGIGWEDVGEFKPEHTSTSTPASDVVRVQKALVHMPVYPNLKFDRARDESYFSATDLCYIADHIHLANEHILAISAHVPIE